MEFTVLLALQIFLTIYLAILFRNLRQSVKKAQDKSLSLLRENEMLLHSVYLSIEAGSKTRPFPPSLCHIPYADETNIVVSVKNLVIPSISAPYNASIGPAGDGYLLFFRYDIPNSQIGSIHLDWNFEPVEHSFAKIETLSPFSEDARFFQHNGHHFLIYNDLISPLDNRRGIRIAAIDLLSKKLKYTTSLHAHSQKIEKNWTPFSHQDTIHFLYQIHPQQIFTLPDPRKNLLRVSTPLPPFHLGWTSRWGAPRGGTPAILVDGEYLAFFHSSFQDAQGILWYVMGAYTFASSSPFKITRISPHPILFQDIYSTPHQKMANPKVRSLYPVGFILWQSEEKERIAVSCGENDSGIKIISMDKKALFASLQKPI